MIPDEVKQRASEQAKEIVIRTSYSHSVRDQEKIVAEALAALMQQVEFHEKTAEQLGENAEYFRQSGYKLEDRIMALTKQVEDERKANARYLKALNYIRNNADSDADKWAGVTAHEAMAEDGKDGK